MAALPDIKHGDSVEIDVALPDLKPIKCPLFSFMGTKWNFKFLQEYHGFESYYSAYIKINDKNVNAQFKPFNFNYRVGITDGTKITNLLSQGYENLNERVHRLFSMPKYNLKSEQYIPPNYTGWNCLRFSITVCLPIVPVLKFKPRSSDKCAKKVSYVNSDASTGSLSKDLSELLNSGLNHDVEVKCKEHTIKVHKAILCARSSVFQKMLQSDFLESQTGIIHIEDMDSSSFLDFIKYIYTELLPELSFEKAITLYETGDKYDVKSLSMRCSDYLEDNLSPDNVYRCLLLADAHCDETLKSKAIAYIINNKLDL